jgi:hypothetical protein
VSGASASDGRPLGELVLAMLFLEPTPERLDALRAAARACPDWTGFPALCESHGILVLARRNLDLAGVAPPPGVQAELERREPVLRELALAFRLTQERFLAECARAGVEVVLLKGAALALDLYPDPALRSQGDLDLLVRPGDVRAAVRAAARAGLWPRALPLWWYRLVHFHVKLVPETALLGELELHWALHHPARLLTVHAEELFERRRPAPSGAATLDPLDRLLHLVTHLASHHEHAPGRADREYLLRAATTPAHPLRLKWILDVRAEVERLHARCAAGELVRRALAWNAGGELSWALSWIQGALGFAPDAAAWVEQVSSGLPAPDRGSAAPAAGRPHAAAALPALHFRTSALARFPRWLWPPRSYLERRHPGRTGAPLRAGHRIGHAARVLGLALLAALLLPVALVSSLCLGPARRRQRRSSLAPERVLDLALQRRALARRGAGGA